MSAEAAAIVPEANTTYTLRGYIDCSLDNFAVGIDAETYDFGMGSSGDARVEVSAVRADPGGDVESWKAAWAEFPYAGGLGVNYGAWATGWDYALLLPTYLASKS